MPYLSRWHQVRALGPAGPGRPYILDRQTGSVTPYGKRHWWRSPSGLVLPVLAGGALPMRANHGRLPFGITDSASSAGAFNIFAAYTPGSAGPAVAARFPARTGDELTDVRYYITNKSGSLQRTIDFELRPAAASFATPDTSTLTGSAQETGVDSVGWHALTGLAIAVTAGTHYFGIIADADGTSSGITVTHAVTVNTSALHHTEHTPFSTSNGWSTASGLQAVGAILLTLDGGAPRGCPYVVSSTPNVSDRKGQYLQSLAARIWGVTTHATLTQTNALELLDAATAPGGTAIATTSETIRIYSGAKQGYRFASPQELDPAAAYRLVCTAAASNAELVKLGAGTGADASVRSAMLHSGLCYWAQSSGTSNWSNDDTAAVPRWLILCEDWLSAEDELPIAAPGLGSAQLA